jgi:hypothetical protein
MSTWDAPGVASLWKACALTKALSRKLKSRYGERNRIWNWVAKLHRLAGRYQNPMPTCFLAPIAGLQLPTLGIPYLCLFNRHWLSNCSNHITLRMPTLNLSYIYLGSSVCLSSCHISSCRPVILSSCHPVIVAERWAILYVSVIKLTKETKGRVSRGRD